MLRFSQQYLTYLSETQCFISCAPATQNQIFTIMSLNAGANRLYPNLHYRIKPSNQIQESACLTLSKDLLSLSNIELFRPPWHFIELKIYVPLLKAE